jgi:hypothetical protein
MPVLSEEVEIQDAEARIRRIAVRLTLRYEPLREEAQILALKQVDALHRLQRLA